MKKIIIVMLALIVTVFCLFSVSAGAEPAVTDPDYIYFAVPTEGSVAWNNFSMVYCHIWSRSGGDIFGWQDKNERCEDIGGGYWRYDLSSIEFDPEGEYSLIFSNENGMQTYNLNITSSCLGDIAVCGGDTCVNPVDGEKSCAVARWKNNGDKVHPAIEIDSSGKTLNVDEVDASAIDSVWGSSKGGSYDLPENTTEEKIETVSPTTLADKVADKEDGINLTAATTWIIVIAAAFFVSIIIFAVILAKRNNK